MTVAKAEVVITYCTQCWWPLRAAWLAQELLSTADDLGKVSLVPGTGGVFPTSPARGVQIWERKADGGFPEAKVLKQRVRDQIDPDRTLATTTALSREAASAATVFLSAEPDIRADTTIATMIKVRRR